MRNVLDVSFDILLVECVDKMDLVFVFICSTELDFVHDIFEIMTHTIKYLET